MEKELIVFFATHWGIKYGGINSFNMDLCTALDKIINSERYQIVCAVTEKPDDEVIRYLNIKFIVLEENRANFKVTDWALYKDLLSKEGKIALCIGHDLVSGDLAHKVSQKMKTKCAIIHHMDFSDYVHLIPDCADSKDKENNQKNILMRADHLLAVGPKLTKSAKDKTRTPNQEKVVVNLIPGLAQISEYKTNSEKFKSIIFGRLGSKNDKVKNAHLAVKALGEFLKNDSTSKYVDSQIRILGCETEKEKKDMKDLFIKASGKDIPLHAWSYSEDREELFGYLRESSLCFMLSKAEGYGLVGWEAIAAGVPLIVSENSGLFQTLLNHKDGIYSHLVKHIDLVEHNEKILIEKVTRAISNMQKRPLVSKATAIALKEELKSVFTWENTAIDFANACCLDIKIKQEKEQTYSIFDLIEYCDPDNEQLVFAGDINASGEQPVLLESIEGKISYSEERRSLNPVLESNKAIFFDYISKQSKCPLYKTPLLSLKDISFSRAIKGRPIINLMTINEAQFDDLLISNLFFSIENDIKGIKRSKITVSRRKFEEIFSINEESRKEADFSNVESIIRSDKLANVLQTATFVYEESKDDRQNVLIAKTCNTISAGAFYANSFRCGPNGSLVNFINKSVLHESLKEYPEKIKEYLNFLISERKFLRAAILYEFWGEIGPLVELSDYDIRLLGVGIHTKRLHPTLLCSIMVKNLEENILKQSLRISAQGEFSNAWLFNINDENELKTLISIITVSMHSPDSNIKWPVSNLAAVTYGLNCLFNVKETIGKYSKEALSLCFKKFCDNNLL